MFFTQAKPEYLEVTYLASKTIPLNAENQTTLTIQSEVLTKIVSIKEVDDACEIDQAVSSFLKNNELSSFKNSGTVLELRRTYSDYAGAEVYTLMRRAAFSEWEDTRRNVRYKKEAEVTCIPSITILNIGTHGKKRARE